MAEAVSLLGAASGAIFSKVDILSSKSAGSTGTPFC